MWQTIKKPSGWCVRACLMLLIGGTFALSTHGAEWREFAPANGRFSVLLPSLPKTKDYTEESYYGRVTSYDFIQSSEDSPIAYGVGYSDYPSPMTNVEEFLNDGMVRSADRSGGKAEARQSISLQGHPGREWTIRTTELNSKNRSYWVNERLYTLSVINMDGGLLPKEDVQRFFDSFQLLEK